jgi:putative ABC transport system permease protein
MHRWLENYAFRIEINGWLLALPVTLVLLLAVVTVSLQTVRTALTNPAKSLRYE